MKQRTAAARKATQIVGYAIVVAATLSVIPGYQMLIVGRIVAVLGIGAGVVLVWTSRHLPSAGVLRRTAMVAGTIMLLGGVGSLLPGMRGAGTGIAAAVLDGLLALLLVALSWESSRRKRQTHR